MQVPRIAWCSIVTVFIYLLLTIGSGVGWGKTPTGKDFNCMSIFNFRKGRRRQNLRKFHNSLGFFNKTWPTVNTWKSLWLQAADRVPHPTSSFRDRKHDGWVPRLNPKLCKNHIRACTFPNPKCMPFNMWQQASSGQVTKEGDHSQVLRRVLLLLWK